MRTLALMALLSPFIPISESAQLRMARARINLLVHLAQECAVPSSDLAEFAAITKRLKEAYMRVLEEEKRRAGIPAQCTLMLGEREYMSAYCPGGAR